RRLLRIRHARKRPARLLTVGDAVTLQHCLAIGRRRPVMRGQREVRRALEHGELRRLLGDDRDRLDAGGARADHGNALALEIDLVMRPTAREIDFALEIPDAVDLRRFWRGQAARGHDVVATGNARALVGSKLPALAGVIPCRLLDLGAEADVAPEIV